MASAVVDLIGSATATMPAGLPSIATNIAVLPSSWSFTADASSGSKPVILSFRRKAGFPIITTRPANRADHASCGHRAKVFHSLNGEALVLGALHNRGCERVLAASVLAKPQAAEIHSHRNRL